MHVYKRTRHGQAISEWALAITLIAAVSLVAFALVSGGVGNIFSTISSSIHAGPAPSNGPDGTLSAPTLITISASSADVGVTLSWSAPTDTGGSAISGYRIYRSSSSGGEAAAGVLSSAGAVTTYTDNNGLTDGDTYYYKVTAFNANGEGPFSNELSASPSGPIVVVLPGDLQAVSNDALTVANNDIIFAAIDPNTSDPQSNYICGYDSVTGIFLSGFGTTSVDSTNTPTPGCTEVPSGTILGQFAAVGSTAYVAYSLDYVPLALDSTWSLAVVGADGTLDDALAAFPAGFYPEAGLGDRGASGAFSSDGRLFFTSVDDNSNFSDDLAQYTTSGSLIGTYKTPRDDQAYYHFYNLYGYGYVAAFDQNYAVRGASVATDGSSVWVEDGNGYNGQGIETFASANDGAIPVDSAATSTFTLNAYSPDGEVDSYQGLYYDGSHLWAAANDQNGPNNSGSAVAVGQLYQLDPATNAVTGLTSNLGGVIGPDGNSTIGSLGPGPSAGIYAIQSQGQNWLATFDGSAGKVNASGRDKGDGNGVLYSYGSGDNSGWLLPYVSSDGSGTLKYSNGLYTDLKSGPGGPISNPSIQALGNDALTMVGDNIYYADMTLGTGGAPGAPYYVCAETDLKVAVSLDASGPNGGCRQLANVSDIGQFASVGGQAYAAYTDNGTDWSFAPIDPSTGELGTPVAFPSGFVPTANPGDAAPAAAFASSGKLFFVSEATDGTYADLAQYDPSAGTPLVGTYKVLTPSQSRYGYPDGGLHAFDLNADNYGEGINGGFAIGAVATDDSHVWISNGVDGLIYVFPAANSGFATTSTTIDPSSASPSKAISGGINGLFWGGGDDPNLWASANDYTAGSWSPTVGQVYGIDPASGAITVFSDALGSGAWGNSALVGIAPVAGTADFAIQGAGYSWVDEFDPSSGALVSSTTGQNYPGGPIYAPNTSNAGWVLPVISNHQLSLSSGSFDPTSVPTPIPPSNPVSNPNNPGQPIDPNNPQICTTGYDSHDSVSIGFDGLGTITTMAGGTCGPITIPPGTPPGPHTITFTGPDGVPIPVLINLAAAPSLTINPGSYWPGEPISGTVSNFTAALSTGNDCTVTITADQTTADTGLDSVVTGTCTIGPSGNGTWSGTIDSSFAVTAGDTYTFTANESVSDNSATADQALLSTPPPLVVVGADSTGNATIWNSADAGATLTVNVNAGSGSFTAVAFTPNGVDGWAVGSTSSDANASGFIYQTTDGGVHWSPVLSTPDCLYSVATDGDLTFAGGCNGAIYENEGGGFSEIDTGQIATSKADTQARADAAVAADANWHTQDTMWCYQNTDDPDCNATLPIEFFQAPYAPPGGLQFVTFTAIAINGGTVIASGYDTSIGKRDVWYSGSTGADGSWQESDAFKTTTQYESTCGFRLYCAGGGLVEWQDFAWRSTALVGGDATLTGGIVGPPPPPTFGDPTWGRLDFTWAYIPADGTIDPTAQDINWPTIATAGSGPINSVVIDPNNPQHAYTIGTNGHQLSYFSNQQVAVLETTDGGQTWNPIPAPSGSMNTQWGSAGYDTAYWTAVGAQFVGTGANERLVIDGFHQYNYGVFPSHLWTLDPATDTWTTAAGSTLPQGALTASSDGSWIFGLGGHDVDNYYGQDMLTDTILNNQAGLGWSQVNGGAGSFFRGIATVHP